MTEYRLVFTHLNRIQFATYINPSQDEAIERLKQDFPNAQLVEINAIRNVGKTFYINNVIKVDFVNKTRIVA